MNKKRLSVVMAGAMLASSVAPVLAATEKTEVSASNKGVLITELTDLLWGKKFAKDTRTQANLRGKFIYDIYVNGTKINSLETATSKGDLQKKIQAEISKNTVTKVEVKTEGFREVKLADESVIYVSTEEHKTYTEADLEKGGAVETSFNAAKGGANTSNYSLFKKGEVDKENKKFVITMTKPVPALGGATTIEIGVNDPIYDFETWINASDLVEKTFASEAPDENTFAGFAKVVNPADVDIEGSTLKEYKITSGGTTYDIADVYDGLMLKENGNKILKEAKNAFIAIKDKKGDTKDAVKAYDIVAESAYAKDITNATTAGEALNNTNLTSGSLKADATGTYKVEIRIADAYEMVQVPTKFNSYTITGKDATAIMKIVRWIDGAHAAVSELSGSDRYATAVEIAKEAELTSLAGTKTKNVVLVNGNSLVDGLAAAPLANYLATNDSNAGNAPILLTESNSLPRATKAYLQELIDKEANKDVTVHIVGGDAVVSNSIARELRSMNLKVQRYAGSDREATSMAVAEKIGFDNGAFVVGATGEADAMSVSGYAASKKSPIIVSGFEGLSEDTVIALNGAKVSVIGGDNAVSEDEYNELKSVTSTIRRISGSDRKATNAAVISTLYTTGLGAGTGIDAGAIESVIVAKDDVLIDALTASNLSAKQNSPIVLGTKSLTNDQINAIVTNAKYAKNVYQVGGDVAREVVKVVAESLGLA